MKLKKKQTYLQKRQNMAFHISLSISFLFGHVAFNKPKQSGPAPNWQALNNLIQKKFIIA